ncbi:MAG TPA: RIP metalloprotease RseP [Gemmatimonadaceae bacterium]|nr:RIP metalloprotease RseP [Gemmatimonadaceae bacterium]
MLEQLGELLRGPAAIIFVLGVVIFVHELGHFLAAKWAGVYAPRFSIGFGPPLWSRKWGETEYMIAAFPLGGYVRMASREDEPVAFLEGGNEKEAPGHVAMSGANDARVLDDERMTTKRPRHYDPNAIAPFGPHPVPEHRLFESKPLYKRLIILTAGVFFNFLLAILVFSIVYGVWGSPYVSTRVVGQVNVPAEAPQMAQLATGDTLMAVNGTRVENWRDFQRLVLDIDSPTVHIRTQRGEVAVPAGAAGSPQRTAIATALVPRSPAIVLALSPGASPAKAAGLETGDSIVAVDGTPIEAWHELVDVIERSPERSVALDVMRDGERVSLTVTPRTEQEPVPGTDSTRAVGKIGVFYPLPPLEYERVPVTTALASGFRESIGFTGMIFGVLGDLFTGRASPKELGGIVQISSQSAEAARSGLQILFRFLAVISLNLAVFNLLPIPILDGGQIALNVVESARGRSFSERTRAFLAYVGLSVIGLIFVLTIFNDLTRG